MREVLRRRYRDEGKREYCERGVERFKGWLEGGCDDGGSEEEKEIEEKSFLNDHPTHRKPNEVPVDDEGKFEFGIGLDYESLLGHATVFSEWDSDWIRYNDTEGIRKSEKSMNVTTSGLEGPDSKRVKGLPKDIKGSMKPFQALEDNEDMSEVEKIRIEEMDWHNIPLHTNLYTGITPAAIHHNAHIHDVKSIRRTQWDRVWFQPFAQSLLDAYVRGSGRLLAKSIEDGKIIEWWGTERDRKSLIRGDEKGGLVQLKDMFAGYEEEIGRDGKGRWRPP